MVRSGSVDSSQKEGKDSCVAGSEGHRFREKREPEASFVDDAVIVAQAPAATGTTTIRNEEEEHFNRSVAAPPGSSQDAEIFIQGLI
jgi:hypothetical protein